MKGVVEAERHKPGKRNFKSELRLLEREHKEFMKDFKEDEI